MTTELLASTSTSILSSVFAEMDSLVSLVLKVIPFNFPDCLKIKIKHRNKIK